MDLAEAEIHAVAARNIRARGCDSLRLIARTARLTGHAVDVDRKNIVGRFRIHDRGDRMRRYRWGALRRQRKNGSGFEEHVPAPGQLRGRSEERRVGEEWVSTGRSRWSL